MPLVQRTEMSTYRLSCDQGKMTIRADGDQYELPSWTIHGCRRHEDRDRSH